MPRVPSRVTDRSGSARRRGQDWSSLSLSLFFFKHVTLSCWTHTESKLQSLYCNVTKFYKYVQGKTWKSFFFVQLKSSIRLDEQGREGKRQENDPSNDCNCGSKNKERGILMMGWIMRQTTHVYVICFYRWGEGRLNKSPVRTESSWQDDVVSECYREKVAAAWTGPPQLTSCQLLVLEGNKCHALQQPISNKSAGLKGNFGRRNERINLIILKMLNLELHC